MKIESSIQKITTGYRINQAKDDPAGLAISQKMASQVAGLDKGTQNAQQTKDALNTADGALSGIGDALGRMKELAVQASNGILTGDDRKVIQQEIQSLKENITDQVKGTQFNTKSLLDGSFQNVNSASGPNGTGAQVGVANTSLTELGIANFDVTQPFDISSVDNAITKITEARSQIGAQTNGLDRTVASNNVAQENTASARSRIADSDIAQEMTRLTQSRITQQYQNQMQKMQQDQKRGVLDLLL